MMTSDRWLPGVGLGILVCVGVGGLLWPSWSSGRVLRGEIGQLEQELSKPKSDPEMIERLSQELAGLNALRDQRMTPIPEERDVAGLMRELSAMLDELGLLEREITTGSPQVHDEASVMPMTVVLSGAYPSVAEAVIRIESLPRLVRVQRLRLALERTRSGAVNRSGIVRADIRIEVFFEPRSVSTAQAGGSRR
ncbi:MAG: hypothetical protein EA380_06785 [Phycisphaeraceae bacterium]|nr:MAG: hypothetical protein EA380_06785 [Phycisphaeraceae bacterium]